MDQQALQTTGSIEARRSGSSRRNGEVLAIEALRWVAALLVAFLHADHERLKLAGRGREIVLTHSVLEFGIGVDIFFFISGFLMFHVCRAGFAAPGYAWAFFRRRLLRVAPLYWLATCGMLAAILAVPSLLNQHVLQPMPTAMSFLLLAWPDAEGHVFPVLNSGWTLNLELYFYLVFALGLCFRRTLGVALVTGWFVITVLAVQAWQEPPWWVAFYGQPIGLEFSAGVLLGVLYRRGVRIGPAVAVAVGLGALLLHAALRTGWPEVPRLPGNGLPAGLVFFACVFCRGVTPPPQVATTIRALGGSSYALYLTSPFAITAGSEALTRAGVRNPALLLAAACALSAVVALAVFRWVERPLGRMARRLLFPIDGRTAEEVASVIECDRPYTANREAPGILRE